ncbi:apolipoprotein L3-like, partial [Octodon degus]|uniref:Apolipoprotein L3-like n=1 Tax=Octodon degus TaxID=10160 RepID=A0A6P3FMQ7_OCTDE
EEAAELHEALKEHPAPMALVEEDRLQKVQQAKERFLAAFPKLKKEVKEDIRKFHALADYLDKVHRDCTISGVVAGSTTAASAGLGILGMLLAPFTLGFSGFFAGAGAALAVGSAVASGVTSIVDYSHISSARSETKELVSNIKDKLLRFTQEVGHFPPKVISSTENWNQYLIEIGKAIRTIKQASCDRNIVVSDQYNMIQNICFNSGVSVKIVLGQSVQNMNIAQILHKFANVDFSESNMIELANNAKKLQEGAKSDYAEELRKLAHDLEGHLKDFEEIQIQMSESHQ